jgi:hypothetical protein
MDPPVRVLNTPVTAVSSVAKKLVDVAEVEVSWVIEVVARVESPDTVRVPLDVNDDVAVILPAIRFRIVAFTASSTEVKKLVEVALSITPYCEYRVVFEALVITALVERRLDIVAFRE